jgi:hypothetical protein
MINHNGNLYFMENFASLQILATDLWRFFEFDSTTARGGCFHLPQVSKQVSFKILFCPFQ